MYLEISKILQRGARFLRSYDKKSQSRPEPDIDIVVEQKRFQQQPAIRSPPRQLLAERNKLIKKAINFRDLKTIHCITLVNGHRLESLDHLLVRQNGKVAHGLRTPYLRSA